MSDRDAAHLHRALKANPLGRRVLAEAAAEAYRDGFEEGRAFELGLPTTKLGAAQRWLRLYFEQHGGEAPTADEVYRAASNAGHAPRTLDRARSAMGLVGHGWPRRLAKSGQVPRGERQHGSE